MAQLDNFAQAWEMSPARRNPDDLGFDELDEDVELTDEDDLELAARGLE